MLWPFEATHAHLLPSGQVLWWPPYKNGDNPTSWNPSTNPNTCDGTNPCGNTAVKQALDPTASPTPATVNIFCSGHAFLPNGNLLQAGGHISDFVGLKSAYIYTPLPTNSWTKLPDMIDGRWYPTNTTLPSGDILVTSGWINTTKGVNMLPQVWQPATGSWRNLSSASLALPFYPFMFVAPNGKVFYAGPSQNTRYLDVCGTGTWNPVINSNGGTRNWGSAVMYDDGKILLVGGISCINPYDNNCTSPPTATAETINLNSSSPSWSFTASMKTGGRKLLNATLLPDGTVLVTGGSRGTENPTNTPKPPAYEPELWNPASGGTWTTMASMNTIRAYHSIALLLPDGRVLSGGGNPGGGASAEIYSPPYLFKSSRPTISSAPKSVAYGGSLSVGMPNTMTISQVTMLALGSVTHNWNMGQRIIRPAFSQAGSSLTVTAPSDPRKAPPGYYMLFILSNGVPSKAAIVQLTLAPPASPNLTATAVSSSQINLSWTDNSNNETGFKVERSANGTTSFGQIATTANCTGYTDTGLTSSTPYYYRVRAYNSSGSSTYSNTANATTKP